MTWWQILLQRPSPCPKSSTLLLNSDCTTLEGECWNSKRCQPDTLTSVHLYIDGFSCRYQLMPSASMFVPIIPFHNHMILFSDSPLISLPSFLHDSLTTWFCIFHSFYILSCSFLAPQMLYHIWVRHLSYHIYRFRCARFVSQSQARMILKQLSDTVLGLQKWCMNILWDGYVGGKFDAWSTSHQQIL